MESNRKTGAMGIHANFGPIIFERNAQPHEGAAFELDGKQWKEAELKVA